MQPTEWYCPATGQMVSDIKKSFLFAVSGDGHRVIQLQEPTLSSDIAFLWGAWLGIVAAAAPLFAAGFLIIRSSTSVLHALGYVLLAAGFIWPLFWGISTILLGRNCTQRKTDVPAGATPPLHYRVGWVTAAKGTGVVCGAATVQAVALFLIFSGTASYIY